MNKKTKLALAAALIAPLGLIQETHAGDEGWAAFGGFVGGTLISSFTSGRSHHGHHSSHHHHETVVVERPSGHYEYQTRKVWIEGHYDYERDRCGRRIKVWHPGHYKYEKVKVWVETRSRGRSCRY